MIRAAATLVTGLLLLAAAAIAADRPAVGSELERAKAAFAAGRHVEALDAARRAAESAPASLPAVLLRASLAEFMGEFDEAATYYGKATTLAPNDPDVIYRNASFAVRVGAYDRALANLDRLLRLHPWPIRWLFAWGPSRIQPALVTQFPSLVQIVQAQIDILMEKGDLARARALALAHGIVQPDRNYCNDARGKAGQVSSDETFHVFRLAALAQPDAADCIWWYGQWLTDEGFVRLGRLMVAEGTRVTPSAGNKASGAAYLRVRLGGDREVSKRAEQLFLIARQRYLRDGDVEGATRLFEEAMRLSPRFVRPYHYRAQIAWDGGDDAAAVTWLERALQVDPESWRTHRNLGRLLGRLERFPAAETELTTAVGLFGDDAGGRLALARVLYAQGKYAEYARETSAALAFFKRYGQELPETRDFLARHERWGPGVGLPPAPDPPVIMGWNYD
jgi:tetratricopeptide (TPR) repeat protein